MFEDLDKYDFILTNNQDFEKEIEKNKTDLVKENDFYSFINKKRKRHFSKKKYNIYKCPSCASSTLGKLYKHIHEKHYNQNNNKNLHNIEKKSNIKEIEYNPIILKTVKISADKKENENNEIISENNSGEKIVNNYENFVMSDKKKKDNEKKNIFECKIIKNEIKEKKKKKPIFEKKIVLKVEKIIAPPI